MAGGEGRKNKPVERKAAGDCHQLAGLCQCQWQKTTYWDWDCDCDSKTEGKWKWKTVWGEKERAGALESKARQSKLGITAEVDKRLGGNGVYGGGKTQREILLIEQ